MDKWFSEKYERERLDKYAKMNLKRKNPQDNFFRKLSITNWFIIFNLLIFILANLFYYIFTEEKVLFYLALQSNNFFSGIIWTPLTSMFMHANFIHLFVNMFSLFFIGNFVERIIGRKRFFIFYIISGIFAGIFFVTLSFLFKDICIVSFLGSCLSLKLFSSPMTYAVGASGAIFALAGLLAILTPKNKVYLIAGPLIAIIIQSILSGILKSSSLLNIIDLLINVYIIFSIFIMFSFSSRLRKYAFPLEMPFWLLPIIAIVPLMIIGLFVDLPIGNMAHLGGLLMGLIYGIYLKKKYKKKTDLISKMFSK
jgi:rhomboid protease GluP